MKSIVPRGTQSSLTPESKQKVWHRRLRHASRNTNQMTITIVKGIQIEQAGDVQCGVCNRGKWTRKPRPLCEKDSVLQTEPLHLVHSNVAGPVGNRSLRGARYFVTLYDDSSDLSMVGFLKDRKPVSHAIKDMMFELETVRVKTIRRFRFDNGGEYMLKKIEM